MRFEENGERINDLHLILSRAVFAATLFDTTGIDVRFMNWKPPQHDMHMVDNIKSEEGVNRLIGTPNQPGPVNFSGLTPLGTELRSQVIDPMIIRKAPEGKLTKPVLVIIVTDGQPAGEPRDTLKRTIQYCRDEMRRIRTGPNVKGPRGEPLGNMGFGDMPVSFQIAQVGNDEPARKFLGELDSDIELGNIIDCTSSELPSLKLSN